jgi:hypothetical protein
MKLKYKLLDKGEGILITRQPLLVEEEIYVSFSGTPPNATAIFSTSEASFYRNLVNGGCTAPINKMNGEVSVTVCVLEGSGAGQKWTCEGLKCDKHKDGGTVLFPNDMNIPEKFAKIEIEFDEHKKHCIQIEEKLKNLENKLSEILEGYDLI